MLKCPKCFNDLKKVNNSYVCVNNHCYDIAKEGYVNLMLTNMKHSKEPGDSVESLRSREAFLNKGHYQKLAEKLSELVGKYFKNNDSFLDAGCGTGYYLELVRKNNPGLNYYAVDIAKKGVAMCAKKNREAICFVGNVFHLPFGEEALDGLMSVFCPYSAEEFSRIIKKGGYVIAVTPGKDHLLEMKTIVYDEPYLNAEEGYKLPDFELVESVKVTYLMHLEENADIETLWRMTPYFHTTSKENNERLLGLDKLDSKADFLVSVYRKVR